jgi:coenzyme F420-reducing hydrogenase beta subunit
MNSSVITNTVKHNLCIGCGICAALCPRDVLAMQWNRYGEYNPVEIRPCKTECSICLKVCPFADSGENEDIIGKRLYGKIPEIQHRPETGYYLASYVGYSEKHRQTSASGGIATWLLEALLAEGIVDHVICVASTGDPGRLFSFQIFDTPEEVRRGAGSAYFPVEMSEIIRQVLELPGRFAITGLPCFIKAIRLAQERNSRLKERIVITVGLVCGQLKSRHFTDYIAAIVGVEGEVMWVRYRGKTLDHPANNFHFAFTSADGEDKKIFWNEGISEAWANRWFTPRACNYCDDVFAECADIACMDAWLPEYSQDHRGTSLMLVRSLLVREALEQRAGLSLDPIPVERVVQSQAGVMAVKRQHLAYRLYLDQEGVPKKRVAPISPKNPFLQKEVILKDRMQALSRDLWDCREQDGKRLQEAMRPDLKRLLIWRQIARYIAFPARTLQHIRGKAGGSNRG